ncbi:MAG: DsbA family protein [Gammaproteobacteria bacterium]
MNNPILYYIHDPMCSWCYAFNASCQALEGALPRSIEWLRVVGGLAPDTAEPMPEPLRRKLQQTWLRIEQTVPGVRFNFDFWLKNTPLRSTYPACRAVLAAKKQAADFELKMIASIQIAYYRRALNPSLPETLVHCAEQIGLDIEAFAADFEGDEVEQELRRQIGLARRLQASSFPALRLEFDGKVYSIAVDYLNHVPMLEAVRSILAGDRNDRGFST